MECSVLKEIHTNPGVDLKEFIKRGFEINSSFSDTNIVTEAVMVGNHDLLYKLIQAGANLDASSAQFVTPLEAAAAKNDIISLQILLDNNCNIHKLCDGRPLYLIKTPLHYAICHGNVTMVELLLQNNHNVNFPCSGDLYPYLAAFLFDEPEILSRIVNHPSFNPSCRNEYYKDPLYDSIIKNKNYTLASVLIECGRFELVDYKSSQSFLSLMLLDESPCMKITMILLEAGADVLHENNSAYDLFIDKYTGDIEKYEEIISLLLEWGMLLSFKQLQQLYDLSETDNDKQICLEFKQKCSDPLSLQILTRKTIRSLLGIYCNKKIQQLPLPRLLCNYLARLSM